MMDWEDETGAAEAALRRLGDHPPDDPAVIDAQLRLAFTLRFADGERALRMAEDALERSIRVGHAQGEAAARRLLAMVSMSVPDFEGAVGHARRAIELFRAAGDARGEAAAEDTLATVLEVIGDLSAALDHAMRALSLARQVEDREREGWALSSVGGVLAAQGDIDGARAQLEAGLAIFEGLEDDLGVIRISGRLGRLELDAGRLGEARRHLERQLSSARRRGAAMPTAGALAALGRLLDLSGDPEGARARYEEALAALEPRMRASIGVEIRVMLAEVRAGLGERDEALPELAALAEAAEAKGARPIAMRARLALAREHEVLGDTGAALHHLKRHLELRDEVADSDKTNLRARLEARLALEAATKDAEIHRLRYVELADMQAQLVEAGKMALLGRLAAGFAHEVNTPLGVLASHLDVAERAARRLLDGSPDEAGQVRVARALEGSARPARAAIARLDGFARSLARFANLDGKGPGRLNVRTTAEDAIALLTPSLPDGVRLERLGLDEAWVVGQRAELNQALMTLLVNAVEAVEGDGQVQVELSEAPDDVVIEVRDDGRGIPPERLDRIFEPGFSSKERVRLGLGLSAVAQTVHRHGGRVEVESRVGEGTTFTVRLPRAPAERVFAPAERPRHGDVR